VSGNFWSLSTPENRKPIVRLAHGLFFCPDAEEEHLPTGRIPRGKP
jgi:hypothetical protein